MLSRKLRAARIVLALMAVLGSAAACSGGAYHPAPYVEPGENWYPDGGPAGN